MYVATLSMPTEDEELVAARSQKRATSVTLVAIIAAGFWLIAVSGALLATGLGIDQMSSK